MPLETDIADAARQAAAERTRRAVQPPSGRQEGAISEWIARGGNQLASQLTDLFIHPEHTMPMPGNMGELAPGLLEILTLRKRPVQPLNIPHTPAEPYYGGVRHDMLNEQGQPVGYIDFTYPYHNDPTRFYVDYIRSATRTKLPYKSNAPRRNFAAHTIGMEDIRSLVPLIAKNYPQVTHVGGFRVSGAREYAEDVWIPLSRFTKMMGNR